MPRRKAVAFLNYIYEETHPLLPATPRATETPNRRPDPAKKSAKESADSRRPSISRQRGKAAPHKSVNLMRNAAATSQSQAEAKTTSNSIGKAAGAKSQPIAQARAESEEEEGDDLNSSQDSQASQVGDLHFYAQYVSLVSCEYRSQDADPPPPFTQGNPGRNNLNYKN